MKRKFDWFYNILFYFFLSIVFNFYSQKSVPIFHAHPFIGSKYFTDCQNINFYPTTEEGYLFRGNVNMFSPTAYTNRPILTK